MTPTQNGKSPEAEMIVANESKQGIGLNEQQMVSKTEAGNHVAQPYPSRWDAMFKAMYYWILSRQ